MYVHTTIQLDWRERGRKETTLGMWDVPNYAAPELDQMPISDPENVEDAEISLSSSNHHASKPMLTHHETLFQPDCQKFKKGTGTCSDSDSATQTRSNREPAQSEHARRLAKQRR